jgi:hypothetical protein
MGAPELQAAVLLVVQLWHKNRNLNVSIRGQLVSRKNPSGRTRQRIWRGRVFNVDGDASDARQHAPLPTMSHDRLHQVTHFRPCKPGCITRLASNGAKGLQSQCSGQFLFDAGGSNYCWHFTIYPKSPNPESKKTNVLRWKAGVWVWVCVCLCFFFPFWMCVCMKVKKTK